MPDRYGPESEEWRAVVEALTRRGYVEGRNIAFERRLAPDEDSATLDAVAAQIVRTRPTVIFAFNSQIALAAKKATSELPIVFWGSGDPVALGLVESLAHPGGNITGNSSQSFSAFAKGVEALFEVLGGFKKLVAVVSTGESAKAYFGSYVSAVKLTAHSMGATFQFVEVAETIADWEALLRQLKAQGVDAAFLGNGPFGDLARKQGDLLIRYRLPAVGNTDAGALLQYQSSKSELATTVADYVDRLIHGTKPAALPVQQPKNFELTINLRTAKSLRLTIPKLVLLRASKLIE